MTFSDITRSNIDNGQSPITGAEPATDTDSATKRNITTADTLMDLVRNLFPPNIIQAATMQMKTELTYPGMDENGTVSPYINV